MLLAIRGAPHYSADDPSLTTWQVDETLDYIEEHLYEVEHSFREAGYVQ